MKIKKFNEEITTYSECEESDYIAFIIYDRSGLIHNLILFNNPENLDNYIINFVNNFIAQKIKLDSEFILDTIKEYNDNIILDNSIPKFIDGDNAFRWYNEYYGENVMIEIVGCDNAKNVQLEDIVKMGRDAKKYNL
jgi:hypothetical protein